MKIILYATGSVMIVAGLWAGTGLIAKVVYLTFLVGWNAV